MRLAKLKRLVHGNGEPIAIWPDDIDCVLYDEGNARIHCKPDNPRHWMSFTTEESFNEAVAEVNKAMDSHD